MNSKIYYDSFKEEMLVKSKRLKSLTEHSKAKGDYHEVIFRELIRPWISSRYEIGHGLLFNEKDGKYSRQCDVIVYDKECVPLFKSLDFVIVNPDDVKLVVEVKSTLEYNSFKRAIGILESVKQLNPHILCSIMGFRTRKLRLKNLYLKAWRSKMVQFLLVLDSEEESSDRNTQLFKRQTEWFVKSMQYYAGATSNLYGYTQNLVVTWDESQNKSIFLEGNITEEEAKKRLSEVLTP